MAITLTEALNILESGNDCSLTYVTANISKGTGGQLITLPRCRIARGHAINAKGYRETKEAYRKLEVAAKNPNHNLHFTRNVELPNNKLRTIHPILIININSLPVL